MAEYTQAQLDAVVNALNSGQLTPEQVAAMYSTPDNPYTAAEVTANLNYINAQNGYTAPQPTQQPATQPKPTPKPAPVGTPSNPGNGNTSADWANIEQGNADWRNSIQSGIFNNPNITLADGSTQTTSYGNLPDYGAYVRNNQDLLQDFNSPDNPFKSIEAYGQWHYQNNGQSEGRELPTGSPSDLGFLQPDVNVNLSPEEQAIYDANQRIRGDLANLSESQLGRVASSFGNTLTDDHLVDPSQYMGTEGLFEFQTDPSVGGFEQVYDDLMSREQPLFDRRRESLENDLMVRGLDPGSEAWSARMDDLNRAENDFSLAATQYAGDVQNRLFNMEGQRRQQEFAENDASYGQARDWRQNQINEALTARNLPLNELNALRTGTQIGLPNASQYQGSNFSSPNFAGTEQENWNREFVQGQQDQNQKNQFTQGLFQLGGAALGGAALGGFGGGLFG